MRWIDRIPSKLRRLLEAMTPEDKLQTLKAQLDSGPSCRVYYPHEK